MSGAVERAIRAHITEGQRLHTPVKRAPFLVKRIDTDRIVLLLGAKRAPTPLRWECLESAAKFLRGRDWARISGTGYSTDIDPDTLDGYLKNCIKRATAGWVAAVLAEAGVIEVDRGVPARARLKAGFAP